MDTCPNQPRLRTHAATIARQTVPILTRFAEEFARACPEARGVFVFKTKRRRFDAASAVSGVVKHFDDLEAVRPWLREVGERFAARGFTQGHIECACEAMMGAIRSCSGENWSGEIESDWRWTLAVVFSMMAEGLPAREEARPMRRAA